MDAQPDSQPSSEIPGPRSAGPVLEARGIIREFGALRAVNGVDFELAGGEHFRTAVRIPPGYATARQWGAELLAGRGRLDEAVEWILRARELDPFSGIIAWNVSNVSPKAAVTLL